MFGMFIVAILSFVDQCVRAVEKLLLVLFLMSKLYKFRSVNLPFINGNRASR